MKNLKISFIFIAFCVFLNAQQLKAQENYINLNYILFTLNYQNDRSTDEINNQLIEEIIKRKVGFILTSEDEIKLKNSNASDSLVKTINENASEKAKKEITEKLYSGNCDKNCSCRQNSEQNIELAKQFIRVFSNLPEYQQQIAYLKQAVPKLEKDLLIEKRERELNKIYDKFNQSFKDENWDDLFETGAKIFENEPQLVDVSLTLAAVGFDNLTKSSNSKYVDETLLYAQKSVELLEKDKASSEFYGAFDYRYKNEKFPDGKSNALGWMNYIIGYIKYFQLNKKDEAIQYFQKSMQYKSESNKLAAELISFFSN